MLVYPGGPNLTTKVLTSERETLDSQRQRDAT